MDSHCIGRGMVVCALLALLSACGGADHGADPVAQPEADRAAAGFVAGSPNVAVADPAVPRPAGTPCSVTLYQDVIFNNYESRKFDYAARCPGPWSRIVLEADYSVSAGRQYDRTAHISIGSVNIYTGTTQEPSATVAPAWRVERDLSDYAPLFVQSGTGYTDLDNTVNQTYTGVLKGSARLLFYPVTDGARAAPAADLVLPLSEREDGRPLAVRDSDTALSKTITFPTNVVRAFIDVLAQGQSDDEFWWSCTPDALAATLDTCGGSAFREASVSIDDQPAGIVPVFPWIFTGGVNPLLWRPIPAVQTLNMMPHRVDLSPFAGMLSDGRAHKISVKVLNARNWFNVSATLLVFRDPGAPHTSGAVVGNDLRLPLELAVDNRLTTGAAGAIGGQLTTKSARSFRIAGYVLGSRGLEHLSVEQTMGFSNSQAFTATSNDFRQTATTRTRSTVTTLAGATSIERNFRFPFSFSIVVDKTLRMMASTMAYQQDQLVKSAGKTLYRSRVDSSTDSSYKRDGSPAVTSMRSSHHYLYEDTRGACVDRTVRSADGKLVAAIDGKRCGGKKYQVKPFGMGRSSALDYWLLLGKE